MVGKKYTLRTVLADDTQCTRSINALFRMKEFSFAPCRLLTEFPIPKGPAWVIYGYFMPMQRQYGAPSTTFDPKMMIARPIRV